MKCLFVAPLKPPDDPVPSGDRAVARLFIKALNGLGFAVAIASTLRMRVAEPSDAAYDAMAERAGAELERLKAMHAAAPPALVFCYHNYYKAPDLIGPELARAFSCPYIVAEASRAPKRLAGPFAHGERLAAEGIGQAALILCPTMRDGEALRHLMSPGQKLVDLKPFLDPADWPPLPNRTGPRRAAPHLITVAMMRESNKLQSYLMLARALAGIEDLEWALDIHGDGAARKDIEAAFAALGPRVRFRGLSRSREELSAAMAQADLFVWPAVDEAFGMAFLEAQLHGLPCLAGAFGGVEDVIRDGETGLLVRDCSAQSYAKALRAVLRDRAALERMGRAARDFVTGERSLRLAMAKMQEAFLEIGIQCRSRQVE